MNGLELRTPFEDEGFLYSREALPERPRRPHDCVHGAAHLAKENDLDRFLTRPAFDPHVTWLARASPLVEVTADGAELKPLFFRTLYFAEEVRNRHILVVGQPGSGKTMGIVMPLLYSDLTDTERSLIVFDAKGEMLPFVIQAAAKLRPRARVRVINFGDRRRSSGWNPLANLPTDPLELESEVYDLAYALCWASEIRPDSRDSVFFIGCAVQLIGGVIQALVLDPGERASLARVREVLGLPRESLKTFVQQHADVPGLAAFLSFLATSSHNAETVLADAQMRLGVWKDKDLCAVTAHGEIDFDELVDEASILVIEMREADVEKLRPIWNLFCTRLLDHLLKRASSARDARLPRPVSLVLDEFASSLGRLPSFETRVNTLRGPRVSVLAAVQSISQIQHLYGPAMDPVLTGFNTKIFMPGLERIDAEYASQLAGTTTVECVTRLEDVDKRSPRGFRTVSRHIGCAPRRLLFPEEISRPKKHFMLEAPATFFLRGTPPFQAYLTRAFELEGPAAILQALKADPSLARIERSAPLEWKPSSRHLATALEERLPDSVLRTRAERLKRELGWEKVNGTAREWWSQAEADETPRALVQILEEMKRSAIAFQELFAAWLDANTDSIEAVLHFVRYDRARQSARSREQDLPFGSSAPF